MIKFALICQNKHDFEVWFSSSQDYDTQKAQGYLSCPFCDSSKIEKALMAPGVSTGRQKDAMQVATVKKATQDMMIKMREVRDHIHQNTEDVGLKFAEEARRIHYGEAEERGIRGQATLDDVNKLTQEGVELAPVPVLPEDSN